MRPRTNGPTGYNRFTINYVEPTFYRCKNHDYMYYPRNWIDQETGESFRKGYYDENGQYYETIAFKGTGKNAAKYECKYVCAFCGTEVKLEWEEGAVPACPNCGGTLSEEITGIIYDKVEESFIYPDLSMNEEEERRLGNIERGKKFTTIGTSAVALIFVMVLCSCCCGGSFLRALGDSFDTSDDRQQQTIYTPSVTTADVYELGPAINGHSYIEVLDTGRTCRWYSEYDSYFDPKTDCYFWFNDEVSPNEWQYWYEEISDAYGEYGWMEYDQAQDKWYIEVDDGEWEALDSDTLPDYMWHIEY